MKLAFTKLDVTFPKINCTAYDIQELAVQVGEKFRLTLNTPPLPKKPSWFSNNDDVLDIDDKTKFAVITAAKVGSSVIEIQVGGVTIKEILVTVVDGQAATLGVIVEKPTDK